MNIVLIDDEPRALSLLKMVLTDLYKDEHSITTFSNPWEGRDYIVKENPDIVFLDIEMPELNGVEIARNINSECKKVPAIIFVTAYPEFSLDAWGVDAVDYVLKPYNPDQISHAVDKAKKLILINTAEPNRVFIRCMPEFDVFVDSKPILFSSKRAKELLAFLVHHEGGWVSIDKITFLLLEETPEKSAKSHVRMLLSRLRKTLTQYGIEDIIEADYGMLRVVPENFDCDYYYLLKTNAHIYLENYMTSYAWAQEAEY